MAQNNPSDITVRLGFAQTLSIFLYDEDMHKSIQGEGLFFFVPCGLNHPSTHNTFLKVKPFTTVHSGRENMGVISWYIMCVREVLCAFALTNVSDFVIFV